MEEAYQPAANRDRRGDHVGANSRLCFKFRVAKNEDKPALLRQQPLYQASLLILAVLVAFENLIAANESPLTIYFEVDRSIDVNIHPTKPRSSSRTSIPVADTDGHCEGYSRALQRGSGIDFDTDDAPIFLSMIPPDLLRCPASLNPDYNPFRDSVSADHPMVFRLGINLRPFF